MKKIMNLRLYKSIANKRGIKPITIGVTSGNIKILHNKYKKKKTNS